MTHARAGAIASALLSVATACGPGESVESRRAERAPYLGADSMGARPVKYLTIPAQARSELVENSAAALSHRQPGVFFTINDSGNDPLLFALDTTGADRGVWRVHEASDVDWEAASIGPCAGQPSACVYIGDTGDNNQKRPSRVIYRVPEPTAAGADFTGDLTAEALHYRYPDQPHDVEAMYVAPNGDTFLITKRPLTDVAGRARQALVFRLPEAAWSATGYVVAELVDSLPIVPGSAALRLITDASLRSDGHVLAVRTYAQVYTFATDSATGRVRGAIPPGVCNIVAFDIYAGEGVTWFGRSNLLLLTSEGRESPIVAVDCPMPRSEP